ncbi:MAG: zinc ABC transporter substrate-binding protein [Opitutales bacterium]|nr:zinc ABC transporter substrate-binding protein [Opitutales bacterium]
MLLHLAQSFNKREVVLLRPPLLAAILALFYGAAQAPAQDKPVVISSFSIVNEWVQTIGGKGFKHLSIIPPGSEAHGFQLSPRHAKELSGAALIVGISPQFEPWLDAWVKANQRTADVVWLNGGAELPSVHDCSEIPHPWTDPREVRKMVTLLSEKLQQLNPNTDTQPSLEQYLKEINAVELELGQLFRFIPPDKRVLISHHANLDQFASCFGLKIAGTILASGSGESADPSARHFSALSALIRKQNIRVIITDLGQNDAFARRLIEDAGLPPPLALSFEHLQPPGRPGDTWASMMRTNGRKLHQALLAP